MDKVVRRRRVKYDSGIVSALLKKKHIDPTEELVKMFMLKRPADPSFYTEEEYANLLQDHEIVVESGIKYMQLRVSLRAKIMLELIQYCAAKLRAVEHTGQIDQRVLIEIVKFGSEHVNRQAIDVPVRELPPAVNG